MPRPLSLAVVPSALQRSTDSLTTDPSPKPLSKAKNRLSKLLHRKSSDLRDLSKSYSLLQDNNNNNAPTRSNSKKTKSKHRQTIQAGGNGLQDATWHKLSMVSEREEPLTPVVEVPTSVGKWFPTRPPLRPSLEKLEVLARAQAKLEAEKKEKGTASGETRSSTNASKHDSILAEFDSLAAVPAAGDGDELHVERPDRQALEWSRLEMLARLRTPACTATVPGSISDYCRSERSHGVEDFDQEPVSPMLAPTLSPIPQVTASDVANLPDFSFEPNAIRKKHQSDAFVASFRDCSNIVTDWQVECFRLRKQLKAVELQLRYKAELLSCEQNRAQNAEQQLERAEVDRRRAVEEAQALKVSNGLKHDESCALKAELGHLQVSDQARHKELIRKLQAMAERLALEEDAVADKDLRIKWLEKERSELERENRVLENVKGALWNHMEIASKRKQPPPSPVTTTIAELGKTDPSWRI